MFVNTERSCSQTKWRDSPHHSKANARKTEWNGWIWNKTFSHPDSGNSNLAGNSKNSSFRPTILPFETRHKSTSVFPQTGNSLRFRKFEFPAHPESGKIHLKVSYTHLITPKATHAKWNEMDEFERKTFFTLIQGIQNLAGNSKSPHFTRPYFHSRPETNRPWRPPKAGTDFSLGNLNFPPTLNQQKIQIIFC